MPFDHCFTLASKMTVSVLPLFPLVLNTASLVLQSTSKGDRAEYWQRGNKASQHFVHFTCILKLIF